VRKIVEYPHFSRRRLFPTQSGLGFWAPGDACVRAGLACSGRATRFQDGCFPLNRLVIEKNGELMRYVLLVCNDETQELNDDELGVRTDAYLKCIEEMESRGVLITRERLHRTSASTTVRSRNGDFVIADGPFAETKEQIGGYFVVEAADLDEAVELASLIPAVHYGTIEVRPIWEM
jgi:hypothetical protein